MAQYAAWRRRLSMKPGMTGLWQIDGRRNPEFDHWVEKDLEYIDGWSLWLDFKIIARTVPAMISGTGRWRGWPQRTRRPRGDNRFVTDRPATMSAGAPVTSDCTNGVAAARPSRVCLVGSSGGHLTHLLALEPWWRERQRSWVTFRKPDAVSRLRGERVYWCYQPTNRNATNLIRNTLLAFRVLRRERPQVIVSSGAGVAVAFAYVAWLLRIKFVFIEVVDRVSSATLTGRLVRPVADLIIVQWPEQQRLYPGSKVVGRLL